MYLISTVIEIVDADVPNGRALVLCPGRYSKLPVAVLVMPEVLTGTLRALLALVICSLPLPPTGVNTTLTQ